MSDLVIFISHKLRSQAKAQKIAEALSAFGGPGIRILYSGEYRAGTKYRPQIENDLSDVVTNPNLEGIRSLLAYSSVRRASI
jgi:hypothetical protein